MPKNYKLCPKCNNALDNNVIQCPYCWNDTLFGNIWTNNRIETWKSIDKKKDSSWCGGCLWCLFFIAFILFMMFVRISFQEASDPHNSPFFQLPNSGN